MICVDFDLIYAPANSITVIQPSVTGISWARGTSHLITWTDNINENVAVYLFNPNIVIAGAVTTKWMELSVTSDPAGISGSAWTWDISDTLTASAGYQVKVVSVDHSTVEGLGINTFSITATSGAFTGINQPVDATSWAKSTTHIISWNDNVAGPVDIYYKKSNLGVGLEEIATDVVGSTYAWTIPLLITGSDYTITLKSSLDPAIETTSDLFDITQTLTGGITEIYQPLTNTSWTVGTTHLISWLDHLSEPVDVYYNNNGAGEVLIDDDVVGTTLAWLIPLSLTTGDNMCKIIVRSTIDPNVVYRESELFELTASSGTDIDVIQPSIAGISWARGTGHYISWDDNFPENVTIDLKRYNSSDVWQQTTSLVDNTPGAEGSTWVWDIDGGTTVSDYYKISIASINDPSNLVDLSDEYFSITASTCTTIEVISPDGGEYWMAGTSHWIAWDDNCSGTVDIELWKSGVYNSDIADNVVGTAYSWAIPVGQVAASDYKVKVFSSLDPAVENFSDAVFDIVPFGKSTSGIPSDEDIISSVLMYPNPTNGHFAVTSTIGISNIEVRNLYGQVLYSEIVGEKEEVSIDMTNYDAGVYIVNVKIKGKVVTKKLFAY
ncbi:MAG: T9SS type A sorting domain-containing protein [Bacteroidetes bacterium]|nr:T9SS type A sorting domain-containing protein [Bacteroidota bacterium]